MNAAKLTTCLCLALALLCLAGPSGADTIPGTEILNWSGIEWQVNHPNWGRATVNQNGNLELGPTSKVNWWAEAQATQAYPWDWMEFTFMYTGDPYSWVQLVYELQYPQSLGGGKAVFWFGSAKGGGIKLSMMHPAVPTKSMTLQAFLPMPSPGQHTARFVNNSEYAEFWFDGVMYNTGKNGYPPEEYLFPSLYYPGGSFGMFSLWGENSEILTVRGGAGPAPPFDPPTSGTPEPGTLALLSGAMGLVCLVRRRRKRRP